MSKKKKSRGLPAAKYISLLGCGDWACEGCGATFNRRDKAVEHVKICDYCGYLDEEAEG
jgi:hypothetical protein